MRVLRFLVWRALSLIPVAFGVITLTFLLGNAIPADPVRLAVGPMASDETIAKVKAEFGLDRPLPEQYVVYLTNLFRGDLGRSLLTRRTVTEDLRKMIPASAELAIASTVIGTLIGIVFGVISAVRKGSWVDDSSRVFAIANISAPQFWTALLLQLVLASFLGLLPVTGRLSREVTAPPHISGLYVVDSLVTGNWAALRDSVLHLILPATTLGLRLAAVVTRITRSEMLDVLRRDYIMNARVAAGLPEWLVHYKYALKNALVSTTSQIGLQFGSLLGGAVLVETVFDWPGLGLYIVRSGLSSDLRPIMGGTLVVSVIFVTVNALTELTYTALDPRIEV